jgi:hypothetical protein
MRVLFDTLEIKYGDILTLDNIQNKPSVTTFLSRDRKYSLLILDTSYNQPISTVTDPQIFAKRWLLLLMVNIRNTPDGTLGDGDYILCYAPPNPDNINSGEHQYYILLFEQDSKIDSDKLRKMYQDKLTDVAKRSNFDLELFVKDHKLLILDKQKFIVNYS